MGGIFSNSSTELSGRSFAWCSYFDSLMLYDFDSDELYNPLGQGLRDDLQRKVSIKTAHS